MHVKRSNQLDATQELSPLALPQRSNHKIYYFRKLPVMWVLAVFPQITVRLYCHLAGNIAPKWETNKIEAIQTSWHYGQLNSIFLLYG
jgi:hypothetical protein